MENRFMPKDTLYLLNMGFSDNLYPQTRFFCPDCTLLEGLLARNPEQASAIDVVYVDFAKPRHALIAQVGEQNQSLPLLVLSAGSSSKHQSGIYNGRSYIADLIGITAAMAERHGFPVKHP
jgi:hypothetical protein